MNIDKNPLPFFELEGAVWTNKKPRWQKNNPNCKGYVYKNNLFPDTYYFQHKLSKNVSKITDITSVDIRLVSDNSIVAYASEKFLFGDENEDRFLIIKINIASDLIGDQYYISTTTDYGRYYSETFCVTNVKYNEIGLVWASTNRVGNMIYQNDFKHKVNIYAKLVPLPTTIEQETEEDGFGNETPTYQKLTQSYFFSAVIPNYLAEALSAMPLHNQFKVIDYFTGESGTDTFDEAITGVIVNVTPEDDACFSFVEFTFVKQIIIKTACSEGINAIVPFNHVPVAVITWNDTQTDEDRSCSTADTCVQTLLIEELYDLDGDISLITEWERSVDSGITWSRLSFASGLTKFLSESEVGNYHYRLKATDSEGVSGYSNVLKYVLFDLSLSPIVQDLGVTENSCGSSPGEKERGKRLDFNVIGNNNQIVKGMYSIEYNLSYAFIFSIYDRNTDALLLTHDSQISGGAAGYFNVVNLPLNASGQGAFYMQLCMVPTPGTFIGAKTTISLVLMENDDFTLSDQNLSITAQIRR